MGSRLVRTMIVGSVSRKRRHGRSITFQMAEVIVPRALFQQILEAIASLRPQRRPDVVAGIGRAACWQEHCVLGCLAGPDVRSGGDH